MTDDHVVGAREFDNGLDERSAREVSDQRNHERVGELLPDVLGPLGLGREFRYPDEKVLANLEPEQVPRKEERDTLGVFAGETKFRDALECAPVGPVESLECLLARVRWQKRGFYDGHSSYLLSHPKLHILSKNATPLRSGRGKGRGYGKITP